MPRGILTFLLFVPISCIPLPIPHPTTEHGAVRGRVIDDDTERPVAGVQVIVGEPYEEPEATTDADGRFAIAEREGWRFLWIIPLGPLDPAWRCESLAFVYPGVVPTEKGDRTYRDVSVSFRSIPPSPILGGRGQVNRGLEDDVGTVRLKLVEPVPRH